MEVGYFPCSVIRGLAANLHSADVMSHDFYQSMMGSNNMSLLAWRVLAEWSIEHSCMDGEMKRRVGQDFNKEWIKFCTWILETKEMEQPTEKLQPNV